LGLSQRHPQLRYPAAKGDGSDTRTDDPDTPNIDQLGRPDANQTLDTQLRLNTELKWVLSVS